MEEHIAARPLCWMDALLFGISRHLHDIAEGIARLQAVPQEKGKP